MISSRDFSRSRATSLRIPKTLQSFERCLDNVVRIRCPDRFRQHIRNTRRLHHRADRAAGDDSRTFDCRLQQNSAGAKQAQNLMRNGVVGQRNRDQVLLRRFDRFADGLGNFLGFAAAVSDVSAFIADNDERAETQVLAALNHFGHAVDGNHGVFQLKLRCIDTLIDQLKLPQNFSPASRAASARALTLP